MAAGKSASLSRPRVRGKKGLILNGERKRETFMVGRRTALSWLDGERKESGQGGERRPRKNKKEESTLLALMAQAMAH